MGRGNVAYACALGLIFSGFLAGCGSGSSPGRLPVYGTVTAPDGEKITGSISFLPAAGTNSPGGVATLKDGKYQFDATNGPMAGPHQVRITPAPVNKSLSAQTAPPREWKLKAEVPAKSPYEVNLQIE